MHDTGYPTAIGLGPAILRHYCLLTRYIHDMYKTIVIINKTSPIYLHHTALKIVSSKILTLKEKKQLV